MNLCGRGLSCDERGTTWLMLLLQALLVAVVLVLHKKVKTLKYCALKINLCNNFSGSQQFLQKAVVLVTKVNLFKLPTVPAANTLKAAECFLKWAEENKEAFATFSLETAKVLRTCIYSGKNLQASRERTWTAYFKLTTSESYNDTWKRLLEAIGCDATPLFWQYVTDKMFNSLLKEEFALPELHHQGTVSKFLYEEANAIRYTAGYVCRSVKTKLSKKASKELNKTLIAAIDNICSNNDDCDDVPAADDSMRSQEWILIIDRGGLCHVNDLTYDLFIAIEESLRQELTVSKAREMDKGNRDKIVDIVLKSEDVQFYLSLLKLDLESETEQALLKMLVGQWVTVRGFSFAGAIHGNCTSST